MVCFFVCTILIINFAKIVTMVSGVLTPFSSAFYKIMSVNEYESCKTSQCTEYIVSDAHRGQVSLNGFNGGLKCGDICTKDSYCHYYSHGQLINKLPHNHRRVNKHSLVFKPKTKTESFYH